jgi:hypothetical protein
MPPVDSGPGVLRVFAWGCGHGLFGCHGRRRIDPALQGPFRPIDREGRSGIMEHLIELFNGFRRTALWPPVLPDPVGEAGLPLLFEALDIQVPSQPLVQVNRRVSKSRADRWRGPPRRVAVDLEYRAGLAAVGNPVRKSGTVIQVPGDPPDQ